MIQWRGQVVSRSWWQRKAVVLSKFVLNASGVGLTWGGCLVSVVFPRYPGPDAGSPVSW